MYDIAETRDILAEGNQIARQDYKHLKIYYQKGKQLMEYKNEREIANFADWIFRIERSLIMIDELDQLVDFVDVQEHYSDLRTISTNPLDTSHY